jgi:hypothetical protein
MLFKEQPFARTSSKSWVKDGYWSTRDDSDSLTRGQGCTTIFEDFFDGDWKDSLHEIREDGTLRHIISQPKFRIDEKVLVRWEEDEQWYKRHFAGWDKHGRILTWDNGKTSFTETSVCPWGQWKLYEEEK